MTTIRPFSPDGWMIVNNWIIDYAMPCLSASAFKCLMLVVRKTTGWHKQSDVISFSQFRELTGIRSNTTIGKALDELTRLGYVLRIEQPNNGNLKASFAYTINSNFEVDAPLPENGKPLPENGKEKTPFSLPENGNTKEHKNIQHDDGDGLSLSVQMQIDQFYNPQIKNTLTSAGISPSVAHKLAALPSVTLEAVDGWITYAQNNASVRNVPAFIVSKIKLGEKPPMVKIELSLEERIARDAAQYGFLT